MASAAAFCSSEVMVSPSSSLNGSAMATISSYSSRVSPEFSKLPSPPGVWPGTCSQ